MSSMTTYFLVCFLIHNIMGSNYFSICLTFSVLLIVILEEIYTALKKKKKMYSIGWNIKITAKKSIC